MLTITIPKAESYDSINNKFINVGEDTTIQLEHSLVSLSKWESNWKKPFYTDEDHTSDELFDYIKCMCITDNVSDEVWNRLTPKELSEISEYITISRTATTFRKESNKGGSGERVTSELIYYWMIAYNIPAEYEKWHLSRLLTLIHICKVKSEPQKKMSKQEIMARNKALNAQRRAKLNTKG